MRISDWSSDVCSSDLAAPLPRPALRLEIDDDVQVTDPGVAEAILRLVQEALTNSARHADADVVHVRLARAGEAITARIERPEERRVGTEFGSTFRSRWWPYLT